MRIKNYLWEVYWKIGIVDRPIEEVLTNPDFLTGVPELLLLRQLSRKPMHGYAVIQSIKVVSGGQLKFGEGSIYPVLHRLEADGMLRTKKQEVDGRSRIVYSVTAAGKKRLAESTSVWKHVVAAVEAVLEGEQHAPERS